MHLLLLSATHTETGKTAQWLDQHSKELNVLKPKLLIGGIGQLQTGYHLLHAIRLQRPRLVIQAGIGGSGSKEDIGKVYAIGSDRLGDLGLMEKAGFSSVFKMGLAAPDIFPFQEEKLVNPYRDLLVWTGLPLLDGVTVNEIKAEDPDNLQRNDAPVVESMEGAALHYVCLMEKIPFLQIRSVSNVLGDRDKKRWKIKESIENLNDTLISLIQKLEKADETLFRF